MFSKAQQIVVGIAIVSALYATFVWVKTLGSNENEYKNLRFETPAQAQKAIEWTKVDDKLMFEKDVEKKMAEFQKIAMANDTAIIRKHNSDFQQLLIITSATNVLAQKTLNALLEMKTNERKYSQK